MSAFSPKQLSTPTRAGAVADELRRMIRAGELAAGTRLRQVDVAAQFAVSTTPVREAFTVLSGEGLVRQDAHRGVIVFRPSRADLVQNYEIRLALEPLATQIAAVEATGQQLDELRGLLGAMRGAVRDDTPRYAAELNPEFHRRIYAAANRQRLEDLIEQMRDAAAAYTQLLAIRPQPIAYLESAQAEHEEIVAALLARDRSRSFDAMALHLAHSRDQMLAALDADVAAADDD